MRLVSAAPCCLLLAVALLAQNDRGTITGAGLPNTLPPSTFTVGT